LTIFRLLAARENSISCNTDKAPGGGGGRLHTSIKVDKETLLKELRWRGISRIVIFIII
jgi:hypothetical protein